MYTKKNSFTGRETSAKLIETLIFQYARVNPVIITRSPWLLVF